MNSHGASSWAVCRTRSSWAAGVAQTERRRRRRRQGWCEARQPIMRPGAHVASQTDCIDRRLTTATHTIHARAPCFRTTGPPLDGFSGVCESLSGSDTWSPSEPTQVGAIPSRKYNTSCGKNREALDIEYIGTRKLFVACSFLFLKQWKFLVDGSVLKGYLFLSWCHF